MSKSNNVSVCIVGAGSMGIVTGYYLQLAGADITYLVRAHRKPQLSKPQLLYSYHDHDLKTYQGYKLITEPALLKDLSFQYIIITLDSASLRAEAGLRMVDELGRIFKGTSTGIILGSVGVDLRSWFIQRSGLDESQVINGAIGNLVYEVPAVDLPLHSGVKPEILAQADYGFRGLSPYSFVLDSSSDQLARDFAALYNRNGVSQSLIIPAGDFSLQFASFPVIIAWELLGWPTLAQISVDDQTWQLGIEAMKEFQRLSIFGQKGQDESHQTTAEGVLALYQKMEQDSLPLDFAAFNKYHHGGKVNIQDHQILRDALSIGKSEGLGMPALSKLVALLPPPKI